MDELQERPPLAASHQPAQQETTGQPAAPDIQQEQATPGLPGPALEQTAESVGQQPLSQEQNPASRPPGVPEDVWAAVMEGSDTPTQDESQAQATLTAPAGTTIEATVEGDKGIIDTITDTLKGITMLRSAPSMRLWTCPTALADSLSMSSRTAGARHSSSSTRLLSASRSTNRKPL